MNQKIVLFMLVLMLCLMRWSAYTRAVVQFVIEDRISRWVDRIDQAKNHNSGFEKHTVAMCSDAFADRTTIIHVHLVCHFKIKDEGGKNINSRKHEIGLDVKLHPIHDTLQL